jgi:CBS domain-containing protein
MKTGIKVADAMSLAPVTILPNKSVYEAAKIMIKRKVGSLLVIRNDFLIGILTEKDVVSFVARGVDAKKNPVKDVMTTKIHTISPDEDLYEALHRMKKDKVRRLPVICKGKLVGMLTQNDILKLQPAMFDIIHEKASIKSYGKKGEKSTEGNCDICENFGRLYDVDGKFVCVNCRDENCSECSEEE